MTLRTPGRFAARIISFLVVLYLAAAVAFAAPPPASDSTRAASHVAALTSSRPSPASTRSADGTDPLAPDPRPPWRPAKAVPRRAGWESAVLLPGRIVSLPLSAVAVGLEHTLSYAEEEGIVDLNAPSTGPSQPARIGLGASHLGDRAGLGGAIKLRQPLGSGRFRTDARLRYAATVRGYSGALLSFVGDPATLDLDDSWRPQERFYGLGPSSPKRVSGYATQSQWAKLTLQHALSDSATGRPWTIVQAWSGPRELVTRGTRERNVASFSDVYPALAPARDLRADHLVTGGRFAIDSRVGTPHWGPGGRFEASAEHYGDAGSLAPHPDAHGATFDRFQLEGETGFSFWKDPRTIRALVRVVDEQVRAHPERMSPADLAVLGGGEGLAGFASGRFHDRDAVLGRLSYIFPISRRLEMDLHSEWGEVSPDVWRAARLDELKNSEGFSVRARWDLDVFAAIGLDFSNEGYRVSFGMGSIK
jgi:hypothetical protein